MDDRYFVAVSSFGGMIGVMTTAQIHEALVAGNIRPTFYCLPAEPAGDLSRRWRPLWAVLGLAKPEGAMDEPSPEAEVESKSALRTAELVEERLIALERRLNAVCPSEPSGGTVGWLLLTFGQFVSVLGCIGSVVWCTVQLSRLQSATQDVLRVKVSHSPGSSGLVILSAAAAFLYSAAMFVVFSRAMRMQPPE